ncbi:unnamed protein product [Leptosia nina]|uniref:Luciferin 4-monooxygenase n=1 Tax=Leptosia nina TaxID=320188 RepID=A0AAV1J445_9NEOP
MSLKLMRGKLARQILKNLTQAESGQIKTKHAALVKNISRLLATQTAPVLETNLLNSLYGEVAVGNETLTDHVFKDVNLWPSAPCVTCGTSGRSYDYGMMQLMIERCAAALSGHLKLSPGERIGLILPNIPEFVVLIHGAMKAGLVVTFANPLYTSDEVRRQFADCNVKAIATIEMFIPMASEVSKSLKDYKGTIWVGGDDDKVTGIHGLRSLLMADHDADLPDVDANDVCLIPYSSGTTGLPKGVMLTHKNLVSNLKQVQTPKFMKYDGEKGKGDVILTVPPFFHIYGFNGILNYNLILGYHIVSLPKFTPDDYIKCLIEYQPSTLFVVPSLLTFLATHPSVKKEYLQSVDSIMVGAAPTTESMLEKFLLKVEKTKDQIKLLQGYGMTESSPVTLLTPYIYPYEKIGSIGQLVPSTQARVISLTTGESLGPHESGELLLRGPQVMKGYWNNEEATKETIDNDGWLHTGDIGYYDKEHFFYIVDRTKELIKVKGNQVSPTEIESIIMEHPEVADVAVVGMPDALAGEVPKAFVVLKPDHKLTEKQIIDNVAQKLAKYKHLAGGVAFLDAIPRNAAGKIMHHVFGESEKWADKSSATCGISGRSYTYGMMKAMIDRFGKALLSHLKLVPGDRIGIILPNMPEFVTIVHGAMQAGLVVTFINPLYTPDEVRRQFAECNVKSIATIDMFMPVAMEVSKHLKDYKGTICVDGSNDPVKGIHGFQSLMSAEHKADLPKIDPNDVCLIPFSSGTTGLPKGVLLTHNNLVANVKQLCRPEFMKHKGNKGTGSVTLTIPPYFHIYGFNSVLNYILTIGSHIISMPKFTPEIYLQTLIKYRPVDLFVVPSLLVFLTNHPAVKKEHLERIESVTVGGAPATNSILEKFVQKAGKTKDEIALLQGYGMTESSPVVFVTPYSYPHEKVGTIGQIVPSTEVKLVSITTDEAVGPNESGEIYVRGPQVMKGYLNNEEATKETVDSEGWLHTGDVAYYDNEHYFYIVDRTKELIKVKGNQVSPTEIENVILQHPEVADVAVIGIPDERSGEVPRAYVVLKPGQTITAKKIYDTVAEKLIKYKSLEGGVEFIDAIPRNVAGKIMRRELKALIK